MFVLQLTIRYCNVNSYYLLLSLALSLALFNSDLAVLAASKILLGYIELIYTDLFQIYFIH